MKRREFLGAAFAGVALTRLPLIQTPTDVEIVEFSETGVKKGKVKVAKVKKTDA